MIRPVDACCREAPSPGRIEVPDVHHDLGLRRNALACRVDYFQQMIQGEVVHGHQKQSIKVAFSGERLGAGKDFFDRHLVSRKLGVALPKDTEAAVAGARGGLDADLAQEDRLIAESSPGNAIGHCREESRLQGSLWEFQEIHALILGWSVSIEG